MFAFELPCTGLKKYNTLGKFHPAMLISKTMNNLPPRLADIVSDFAECVGQEKLDYLLYLAESFPELPGWLAEHRAEMAEVPECMTPVFLHVDVADGKLVYIFDVPEQSPTVRGFATLLSEGVNGATAEEVLKIPAEFYLATGLHQVLSSQRLNGLSAMLAHMKQLATLHLDGQNAP